jgi:hypothetical protein
MIIRKVESRQERMKKAQMVLRDGLVRERMNMNKIDVE